jgi:hypothetical protein
MNIEKMTVNLRVRSSSQALDLGAQMLRNWAFQIYMPFALILLVTYVLLVPLFYQAPWAVFLIIWFFKPVWDHIPLYVLSRRFFGEETTVPKTLSNWLPFLRPGLVLSLFWYRLNPFRAMILPVIALEGQTGKQRKRRLKITLHSLHTHLLLLIIACLALETFILFLSLLAAPDYLFMRGILTQFSNEYELVFQHFFVFCWLVAFMISEPFYIACGFSLYINRRTNLEAWDLELLFRRMAKNAQTASKVALFLVAALLSFQVITAPSARADEPPARWEHSPNAAPDTAEEILAQPPFSEKEVIEEWRLKPQFQPDNNPNQSSQSDFSELFPGLQSLVNVIAKISLVIIAIAIIALIAFAIIRVRSGQDLRFWRRKGAVKPLEELPEFLAGVHEEITQEERVVVRAQALWQEGKARAAMSLLYRGGLLKLITSGQVQVKKYHTEQECQQQIKEQIGGPLAHYFENLTHHWIYTAYAHQNPQAMTFQDLCQGWESHLERNP